MSGFILNGDSENLLKSFSNLTECGCMLIDSDADIIFHHNACCWNCPAAKGEKGEGCKEAHRYAVFQAERFGGKYIYFCPAGFIFCIVLIQDEKDICSLLAGPIMATDRENVILTDLSEPFTSENENEDKNPGMKKFLDGLKTFQADKITDLSNVLQVIACHIGGTDYVRAVGKQEKMVQQQQINDYIQSIKARLMLGVEGFQPYPYDKEKKLTYAITTGNAAEAKRYLNEILGHIFFASANNLDAIKIRAMELSVLISRAALDGGADMNHIYQLNLQYISDFFKLETIEDVCFSLTEILKKFSEETFQFAQVKHVDLLSKAVSFIRANYMHKITLDDVAAHIYLSPSYLSKIFKEEMKTNFNSYLNEVRIEKSKILLLSEQLSIVEISELVGFFDQSYFNKVFKKLTGITPKKYRAQKREM